jgi:hypothetical protein
MRAPADSTLPPRPVLMRLTVRSWEYRHPRAWAGFRFACGIWNLGLGVLLLSYGYWLGLVPLVGSVLIFWTVYRLRGARRRCRRRRLPAEGPGRRRR